MIRWNSFFTLTQKLSIYSVLLVTSVLFSTCRKEKLEGDFGLLVGKWKWYKSTVLCDPKTGLTCDEKATYNTEIEFIEKGKYILYKENKEIEKGRILTKDVQRESINNKTFTFYYLIFIDKANSGVEIYPTLQGSKDTLSFTYYPSIEESVGNFFVRQ
jgi:hypothetical protein